MFYKQKLCTKGIRVMEYNVDLCVVGAAGSGMAAAITAAQQGAKKILVLEKQNAPGGCTVMSAGMMGINTPVQKKFGYHYDVDKAFKEVMRIFNWRCDAKLVRKWLDGSGENFEWLEDLGVSYDFCCTESADENETENYHNRFGEWDGHQFVMKMQGPILVKALRQACKEYGIEILTNTRAKHLLVDENGNVIGVEAEGKTEMITVYAGAVILATGSVSSNKQLIERFYAGKEYENIHIMAQVPHNTGDGLIMAEEIGAADGKIGTLFIGPHNHYERGSEVVSVLMRRPNYIKVNMYGERFVDESIPLTEQFGWMMANCLDGQPGKKCYVIYTQENIDELIAGKEFMPKRRDNSSQLDAPAKFGPGPKFEEGQDPKTWRERIPQHLEYEESRGIVKKCETIDEIAKWIGCDEETLKKTISNYNAYCYRGYDEEFLKDPRYLTPCEKGPYYVILGRSGIDTCLGGLKIDNHQRVLKWDGNYIPGLYAAGVMCSGWFNGSYCYFGSEMSFTIYSGRSAGKEAVEYLVKS